jgi:hypothetical protein
VTAAGLVLVEVWAAAAIAPTLLNATTVAPVARSFRVRFMVVVLRLVGDFAR